MQELGTRKPRAWGLLVLALLILLPWSRPAAAQEPPPPEIEGIEPNEGRPGQQMQATIWGSDIDEEAEVIIEGVGVEVIDRSPRSLSVQLFIADDTPPGPRDVMVINHVGPAREGILPSGFVILGEPEDTGRVEPGPDERPVPREPPREREDGLPWGTMGLLAGVLVLIGAPVAAYLTLDTLRRRRLTFQRQELEQWQEQAQQELPRRCQPGVKLPIIGRQVKPGTWQIVHLVITAHVPVAGSQPYDDQHFVGGKIARRLNEIIALRKRTSDENRLDRMVAPVAKELASLLWAWAKHSGRDRQINMQANLEGKVAYRFKLYECEKTEEGTRWREKKDWEGTITETKELAAGQLVGPQQRERKGPFQTRAAETLRGQLLALTLEVSSIK
jgi:hypothetical protein